MPRAEHPLAAASERCGKTPRLVLYSREYCHLCHEMLTALQQLCGVSCEIEVVNVGRDPELERRFGERVPLLMHAGTELCRYRLEPGKVRAYLSDLR